MRQTLDIGRQLLNVHLDPPSLGTRQVSRQPGVTLQRPTIVPHRDSSSMCGTANYFVRPSSLATALMTRASIGSMAVGKTAAMRPSRPIRYLWKFQRGVSSGRSLAAHL